MGEGDYEVFGWEEGVSYCFCVVLGVTGGTLTAISGRLRRAFLLVDAEHGVKRSDEQLLAMLRQNAIPHQILLSKVDKILLPGSKFPSENALAHNYSKLKRIFEKIRDTVQPEARDGPPALGEILTCSAEKSIGRGIKLGINGIRWAILSAVGLENPHSAPPKIEVREEQSQSLDNP